MNYSVQHFAVFLIVGFAVYQLFGPVVIWIYKKLIKNANHQGNKEDLHSCYTETCSRCKTK